MPKVGTSWLAATLALAAYAALFLGNCGGESLNGSGTGGTSGAGGFLDGAGGFTGTGGTTGSGGLATGGTGGDALAGGTSGGDGGAGGTTGAGGDCALIIEYPPLIAVVDISNGAPICDPTFAIIDVNASNPIVITDVVECDGIAGATCPGAPPDGGLSPCRFALTGLAGTSVQTLQVSAPGYLPSTAYDIVSGVGGCVPSSPASQVTVPLFPAPADGGINTN